MIKLKQATSVALLATGLTLSGPSWAISYDLAFLGGDNSIFADINNAGQIVGASLDPGDFYYHATLWNGTVSTDLGTLGGTHSSAEDINEAGHVVGTGGFRWNGATMIDLGSLGWGGG
jgi:probable HAF family extracellular repeat protein